MEKIDKELLLKDLCARLPYGVICNTPEGDGHLCSIIQTIFGTEYGINIKATERDYFNDREVCIKPYLRTMSSMTEEEEKEFLDYIGLDSGVDSIEDGYIHIIEVSIIYFDLPYKAIDWLNKNMFDYRGLIPKNLAIEITKENNPLKYTI